MDVRVLMAALVLIIVAGSVSGMDEMEPNDSLDSPQIIGEGVILGYVNGSSDMDIFRVDVPPDTVVFYSVKKTSNLSDPIIIRIYNSYREQVGNDGSGHPTQELNVSGEIKRYYREPSGIWDEFFIVVSGMGGFEVHVQFEEIGKPDGTGKYRNDSPMAISDGDTARDSVYVLRYGSLEFAKSDTYVMEVKQDAIVKAKIAKTDPGPGTIHASIGRSRSGKSVELDEIGESDTLEYKVYLPTYESSETLYIEIYGEGEYEVEIYYEELYPEPTWILGLMLAMFCMVFVMSFLPVIVVIIVIILIVRGTTKKKDGKRRKNLKKKKKKLIGLDEKN